MDKDESALSKAVLSTDELGGKKLNARLTKCLLRVAQHKSKPDFGAVMQLENRGFISMTGTSDDISIALTTKGREYLET